MSRKGNYWGNAIAERFFKKVKYECTNRCQFKTHLQVFDNIKNYRYWCNYKRIHAAIGHEIIVKKDLEIRINIFNNVA